VREYCQSGVDGLPPQWGAHWDSEQKVGFESEGGRASTLRGEKRALG
jgi:hypothetical protein